MPWFPASLATGGERILRGEGRGLLGRLEAKGDWGVVWPRLMGKCLSTGRLPSASPQALCTDGRSGVEQG